jgi:Ca2+-dependent lipid-binding protein
LSFNLSGSNPRATWRSKTHKGGGKAPSWNEKHSFDVIEGDDRLQIQVYDEDTVRDDLIGSVVIDLS